MDTLVLLLPLVIFTALLILRVQIAIVFALSGIIGIALLRGFSAGVATLGLAAYSESSNYILTAIPLFIMMGNFLYYSGISKQLYEFAYAWSGRVRGSLAYATIAACVFFGACTGSSMAAVGTLGPVALREMERYHYHPRLAYGCITSGASLGIMIPPSLAFIVYGYVCAVPVGPLFIAGILPGIVTALMLVLMVLFLVRRYPELAPGSGHRFTWRERFASTKKIWWAAVLFGVIVGGIVGGLFTATEAAGAGAFMTFLILLSTGKLPWKVLRAALTDTAKTSCMIFTIIIGAKVFNTFLGLSGIPQAFAEYMIGLPINRYWVLALILLLYIPLGCFIDSIPLFFLTLPVVFPVIDKLGFDPLLFGVLVTLVAQISLLTPPVGMNVYVLSGSCGRPLNECFAGSLPFLIPLLLTLVLLVLFPQISLFLPGLMK